MKPNLLAILLLRLLGIYCLTQSVPVLGMFGTVILYAQNTEGASMPSALVASLLPGLCLLTIGVLLIVCAKSWGEKLVPVVTPDMDDQPDWLLYWESLDRLKPHKSGKLIVCGHSPQRSGRILDLGFALCIDTGAVNGGWWQSNEKRETRRGSIAAHS